jgi:site-specific DNA recombinase
MTLSRKAPRAVLYLRLSVTTDESTSIVRQENDLRDLAEREAWDVVQVLTDDGLSGGKRRAKAERALEMIREGSADVIAVWKFDRWSRQGVRAVADLVETIDLREASGHPALFVAMGDGIRSDAATWRMHVSLIAEVGRLERENVQTRVSSARKHQRETRRHSGEPGFGYRPIPHPSGKGRALEIHPDEATTVRRAFDLILSGKSAYMAAKMLNEEGHAPRRSAKWTSSTLADVMQRDSLLGYMTHRLKGDSTRTSRPLLGEDGLPEEVWPAIVTSGDMREVRALLGSRGDWGRTARAGRKVATRLLSGHLACASCGRTMRAGQGDFAKNGKRVFRYVCGSPAGACTQKVSIDAVAVEEFAARQFLDVFGGFEVVEMRETSRDNGELAEVEQAINATAADMASPDADFSELVARLTMLRARRELLASVPAEPVVEEIHTGDTFVEAWAARDVDGRRSLIAQALTGPIVVRPVKQKSKIMDWTRVEIPWRGNWDLDEIDAYLIDAARAD